MENTGVETRHLTLRRLTNLKIISDLKPMINK